MKKIHIPVRIWKRSHEQIRKMKLFQSAKLEMPFAVKKCSDLGLTVWTYEQIDALNYYLSVRDEISKNGRMHDDGEVELYRTALNECQKANILWIKNIKKGYYLMCAQYRDGVLSLYLCKFKGEVFKPICDVTEWSELKNQSEEVII